MTENKYKNKPTGIYKSKLEQTAAILLTTSDLEFKYEP